MRSIMKASVCSELLVLVSLVESDIIYLKITPSKMIIVSTHYHIFLLVLEEE